ncbi:MAG TPA: glycosyltransferase [Spirochaetota bacterium]|nr:glycosyltransferase [Spirochaetota bacterium]
MKQPLISVILPVYNGSLYLKEAIDSILKQTFTDFEFIIINDGSKDNSEEIIKSYKDYRIIYISQQNRGLAATLNIGIKLSKGKYIARMDQDDISLPVRFEKQIDFLEKNINYDLVGTWAKIFPDKTNKRFHKHPTDNIKLKYFLLFNNPFVHSSVMIRKSVFDKVGFYSEDKGRQPPEDYELWSRIARVSFIANIPEVLLFYREVSTGMSNDKFNPFLEKIKIISSENISFYCENQSDKNLILNFSTENNGFQPIVQQVRDEFLVNKEKVRNLIIKFIELYNYSDLKIDYNLRDFEKLLEVVTLNILKKNDISDNSILKNETKNTLDKIYITYIKKKNYKIVYLLKRFINKLTKIRI